MTKGEIAKNNFMQATTALRLYCLHFVTIWDLMNRLLLCLHRRSAAE